MLKNIHVENYKSLKNVDVSCARLNLLVGVNGAGKSSFIQILRMLHLAADKIDEPSCDINVEDFGGGYSENDIHYCYGCKFGAVFNKVRFVVGCSNENGDVVEIERIIGHDGHLVSKQSIVSLSHPNWRDIVANAWLGYDLDQGLLDEEECRIRNEERDKITIFKKLWRGFRFIDAFRKKPIDVSEGVGYSPYWGVNDFGDVNPEGADVMEIIYKFPNYAGQPKFIEMINKCLDWVSPGARLEIHEKKVGDKTYYESAIDYGVEGDARMFKPQNVGLGVSYILPVLVALLGAEKGNVLVIENPEAHLHPRGQAEIGKLIAETVSRGVQVFVETHSDHLINGVRVAVKQGVLNPLDVNILFFERKEREFVYSKGEKRKEIYSTVKNIKIDENGSLSEYPEDFMDEWTSQLSKLI